MSALTKWFVPLGCILVIGAGEAVLGDVTAGLFSRYTFEVDASDSVGSNHGTLVNGASVIVDAERGNVLLLDGTNDYVSLPTNNMARGRSEITVTMWIRPDEWVGSNTIYDEYGGDYSEYWQFSMRESGWYTRDSSTGPTGSRNNDLAFPSVPVGEWHHLAFVYSVSSSLKAIYYDGSPYASTSTSVDQLTTDRAGARIGFPCDGTYYDGRMDELRFYNRKLEPGEIEELATPQIYTLTVNSGSGSGDYIAGSIVPISADPAPSGKGFVEWIGDTDDVDDVNAEDTTVAMPLHDVEVTAYYADLYSLSVHSGSGGGDHPAGALVSISADPPPSGQAFDSWTGDVGTVADIYDQSTTLIMPSYNCIVTATYVTVPGYYLTVQKGTGDGTYMSGTIVEIDADAPASGLEFTCWVGDTTGIADVNSPSTTFTMPPSEATISAYYRDAGAEIFEIHQDLDEAIGRIYRLDDKPYLDLIDENGFFQCETLIFSRRERKSGRSRGRSARISPTSSAAAPGARMVSISRL